MAPVSTKKKQEMAYTHHYVIASALEILNTLCCTSHSIVSVCKPFSCFSTISCFLEPFLTLQFRKCFCFYLVHTGFVCNGLLTVVCSIPHAYGVWVLQLTLPSLIHAKYTYSSYRRGEHSQHFRKGTEHPDNLFLD